VSVTLGIRNASFVAQTADWIPDLTHEIIKQGFRHRGFSFIRVIQRCPEFLGDRLDPWVQDPARMHLLTHRDGAEISDGAARIYPNIETHDPADRNRAREISSTSDPMPVGVLYRNTDMPCYEDSWKTDHTNTPASVSTFLETEFDKFTIDPVVAQAGQ